MTTFEDAALDGDYDLEDLAAFRVARPHAEFAPRTSAYLALQAHGGTRADGLRELGAAVILQVPIDGWGARMLALQTPAAALKTSIIEQPSVAQVSRADERETASALSQGVREGQAGPRSPAAPSVTFDVARACVHAAWRVVGVADDERIDGLAGRARWSAVLPELRLRLARNIDESGRVTLTTDDAAHYTEVGAASHWLEARLTFRLDRLLFADEEVALERLRAERSELRSRTAAKALQALFEWQRAYTLAGDPALAVADHLAAVGREIESSTVLDIMTDGWFSRYRATLPAR